MKLKPGDRVYYKNDPDQETYIVCEIYSKTEVSLGLLDYPDTEQDYLTDIKDIVKVNG